MSAIGDIMRLLNSPNGRACDWFVKHLHSAAQSWDDVVAPLGETVVFRAWATSLYETHAKSYHQAMRLKQLRDGHYPLWVYRADTDHRTENCAHHQPFDRIAIPTEHPFWETHFPANGWFCNCRVSGARTSAGIVRVGGDPDRELPSNWRDIDDATGLPLGIEYGFSGVLHPTVADCLRALQEGRFPLNAWFAAYRVAPLT